MDSYRGISRNPSSEGSDSEEEPENHINFANDEGLTRFIDSKNTTFDEPAPNRINTQITKYNQTIKLQNITNLAFQQSSSNDTNNSSVMQGSSIPVNQSSNEKSVSKKPNLESFHTIIPPLTTDQRMSRQQLVSNQSKASMAQNKNNKSIISEKDDTSQSENVKVHKLESTSSNENPVQFLNRDQSASSLQPEHPTMQERSASTVRMMAEADAEGGGGIKPPNPNQKAGYSRFDKKD